MDELKAIIDGYVEQPLSDQDIEQFMENKCSVIRYGMLKNIKNIDQILEPYGVCFILYQWSETGVGHWVVLIKSGNLIEYFDPYGGDLDGMPDAELRHVPKNLRKQLGEDHPYLSDLLEKCPYQVTYNEIPFQRKSPDVATCGKWCLVRGALKDMDLYTFQKLFQDMYGDQFVTILTAQ